MPVFKHRPGALPRQSSQPHTDQPSQPGGKASPFAAQAGGHTPAPAPAERPPPNAGTLPATPHGAQQLGGSAQSPDPQAVSTVSSGPGKEHSRTPQEGEPSERDLSSQAARAPANHEQSPSAAHPEPEAGRSQGSSHVPGTQGIGAASGQGRRLSIQQSGSSSVAAKTVAGAHEDAVGASGSPQLSAGPLTTVPVPGASHSRSTQAETAAGRQADEVPIPTGTPSQQPQAGGRAAPDQAAAGPGVDDDRPILSDPASTGHQPRASEPLTPPGQQPAEVPGLSRHARGTAACTQPDHTPILTGCAGPLPSEERVGSGTSSTQPDSPHRQPEHFESFSAASSETGDSAPQQGPLSGYRTGRSGASESLVHLPRLGRTSIVGDEPLEGPLPPVQTHILVRQSQRMVSKASPVMHVLSWQELLPGWAWCSSTCLMHQMPMSHSAASLSS